MFANMLQLKSFTFNPFMENTYVLFDETKEGVIFDPGCYEKNERETLHNFILTEGLTIKYLINNCKNLFKKKLCDSATLRD